MLLKVAVRRERDQESTARVALEKEASSLRERMHEMEAHASARSGGRGGGGGGGIEMILCSFGRRQQAGDARGRFVVVPWIDDFPTSSSRFSRSFYSRRFL